MMGLGHGFILVIIWVAFITVSPHPTDLTDNLFYNADLSLAEPLSDAGTWSMPDSPPRLNGIDDDLTALSLSDMESVSNEVMDGDSWGFFDESTMDSPDGVNEPVDAALALNHDPVEMNPAGCSTHPSKRQARRDMTLGMFTCFHRGLRWHSNWHSRLGNSDLLSTGFTKTTARYHAHSSPHSGSMGMRNWAETVLLSRGIARNNLVRERVHPLYDSFPQFHCVHPCPAFFHSGTLSDARRNERLTLDQTDLSNGFYAIRCGSTSFAARE